LLFTLKRGCGVVDLTEQQIMEAETVFLLVAALTEDDGLIRKDELVLAHGGGDIS
jgi:hypothetical protein